MLLTFQSNESHGLKIGLSSTIMSETAIEIEAVKWEYADGGKTGWEQVRVDGTPRGKPREEQIKKGEKWEER